MDFIAPWPQGSKVTCPRREGSRLFWKDSGSSQRPVIICGTDATAGNHALRLPPIASACCGLQENRPAFFISCRARSLGSALLCGAEGKPLAILSAISKMALFERW